MAKKHFTITNNTELEKMLRKKGFLKDEPINWNGQYEFIIRTNVDNKTFVQGHRKPSLDQIDIEELKKLKEAGLSNRELSKKFNCCERTIRRYLKA